MNVIPQVMTCHADEFLFVVKYVQSLGYKELNWNLGCPYPMVTNKGMGSGLVNNPDKIDEILDRTHTETDITISMKMRMGYDSADEILKSLPILEKYPLKSIGIHARIGKQLYKGGVDLDSFQRCIDHTSHTLFYNGDITSVAGFRQMSERFPSINHWMLGRGLIADPFLPNMIKDDQELYPEDRMVLFSKYHDRLFTQYEEKLTGDKAIIRKLLSYWEYFSGAFNNPEKIVKKIKKTKTIEAYDKAIAEILEDERNFQKKEDHEYSR